MTNLIPVKNLPLEKCKQVENRYLVAELHAIMDNTSISTKRLIGSWKTGKQNCTLPSQALSCSGSKGLSQPISQQSRLRGSQTVENTGTPGAIFITNNPIVIQRRQKHNDNAREYNTEFFITVHNGIHKLKVSNTSFIHILLTISLDKMVEQLLMPQPLARTAADALASFRMDGSEETLFLSCIAFWYIDLPSCFTMLFPTNCFPCSQKFSTHSIHSLYHSFLYCSITIFISILPDILRDFH